MSVFFFYNNFKNTKLIDKISTNYIITDGFINIKSYINNILDLNGSDEQLYGKIVYFNINVEYILEKINKLYNLKYRDRYIIQKIDVYKLDNSKETAYIIY
jgi:hypothetical protein